MAKLISSDESVQTMFRDDDIVFLEENVQLVLDDICESAVVHDGETLILTQVTGVCPDGSMYEFLGDGEDFKDLAGYVGQADDEDVPAAGVYKFMNASYTVAIRGPVVEAVEGVLEEELLDANGVVRATHIRRDIEDEWIVE